MLQATRWVTVVCATLSALLSVAAADSPIVLDSRKQLFLDDYFIGSMTNVKRTVEQAHKFENNPVLYQTESWESPMAIIYGTILREGGQYRMWYLSLIHISEPTRLLSISY